MTRFRKAAQAFEAFSGHKARRVTATRLTDENVAGWRMGPVVGIAYEARRDGKTDRYFHEFAKSARPDLVSSDNGKQLFLTGGNYTVTERGIEDVPELFVVNPSPRRAAARKGKPMAKPARNRKGRFVKRGAARATYKRNPAPRRKRRRSTTAKRRRASTRQVAVFRANPVRRRRYKRNPIPGVRGLGKMIVPAMGVGAGAVGSEIVMGYLPIPAQWKTGVMRHITKGGVGVAAGMILAKVLKQKALGFYVAAGAIAIATHDALKEFIAARLPMIEQSGFGGMGYINSGAIARFGQYVAPLPSQFGQYVAPLPSQFGGASQAYEAPGGETDFRA